MARVIATEESAPATPSAGTSVIWPDSAHSGWWNKDDTGRQWPISGNLSAGIAAQAGFAADTVVTGSRILTPSGGLQAGMVYHVRLSLSKSAAGIAAPVWTVRLGTLGTTSDASQWTVTGVAQTAVAETGYYELLCTVRSIGAAGVLQGSLACQRTGGTAATGLASVPIQEASGAGADKAWASGQGILLSINGGGSAAWTITQCVARLW